MIYFPLSFFFEIKVLIDIRPLPHVLVISAIHKPDLETEQADSVRRPLVFQQYG